MKSIFYKKASKVAKKIAKNLTAMDTRFNGSVIVRHEDGSVFIFENAFAQYYNGKGHKLTHKDGTLQYIDAAWLFVFTEHHGNHIYSIDDLLDWRALGPRIEIENVN